MGVVRESVAEAKRQGRWCVRGCGRYAQGGACGDYCSACARSLGLIGRYGRPAAAMMAASTFAAVVIPDDAPRARVRRYWDPTCHQEVEFEVAWDGT